MRQFTTQSLPGSKKPFEIADHTFKMGPYTNTFVGFGIGTIDRDGEIIKATFYTAFGASLVEQGQVRIGRDFNALLRCIFDHIKEARVHHWLAETLQVQTLQALKVIDNIGKGLKCHESRRSIRWTI